MLSNTAELSLTGQQPVHHEEELTQEQAEALAMGELLLEGAGEESVEFPASTGSKKRTPTASRRESLGGESLVSGSAKRRGRPRGWTDARIHQMLTYLERNMTAYRSCTATEFYSGLCMTLGYDLSECHDIQEKCEKMVKKYENDTRRGDISWKWYPRMNQVFGGPPLAFPGGLTRPLDDDAASSSLDSGDEEESAEGGENLRRRPRGEDPFQDRLEHEKLLLKLKKLKSKTEMRYREWDAHMDKQKAAFEELKGKTNAAIQRLEKSILNAGYELDQAEMLEHPQV